MVGPNYLPWSAPDLDTDVVYGNDDDCPNCARPRPPVGTARCPDCGEPLTRPAQIRDAVGEEKTT